MSTLKVNMFILYVVLQILTKSVCNTAVVYKMIKYAQTLGFTADFYLHLFKIKLYYKTKVRCILIHLNKNSKINY